MKKITLLLYVLLSIALLAACSNSLVSTSPNSETALIQVVNNSDSKIHVVELNFSQLGTQLTTQGVTNADGSAFRKGDILSFELNSSDIDFDQPVTIESSVTIDNVKVSVGTVRSIQLSKGNAFNFEITEDTSSNLIFEMLEMSE